MAEFRTKIANTALRNVANMRKKTLLNFKVGDQVGLSIEAVPEGFQSSKLFPRFKGPYKVIKSVSNGKVLYLEDMFGEEMHVPVSVDRLIAWQNRAILNEIDMDVEDEIQAVPLEEIEIEQPIQPIGDSPAQREEGEIIIPEVNEEPFVEDMLLDAAIDSKFKLNDRVKVKFESGFYYGNISKFENKFRTVRFDDGEVLNDVLEEELLPVKVRAKAKDKWVVEPTTFRRVATRSRYKKTENVSCIYLVSTVD
jgi:hypothetical protein